MVIRLRVLPASGRAAVEGRNGVAHFTRDAAAATAFDLDGERAVLVVSGRGAPARHQHGRSVHHLARTASHRQRKRGIAGFGVAVFLQAEILDRRARLDLEVIADRHGIRDAARTGDQRTLPAPARGIAERLAVDRAGEGAGRGEARPTIADARVGIERPRGEAPEPGQLDVVDLDLLRGIGGRTAREVGERGAKVAEAQRLFEAERKTAADVDVSCLLHKSDAVDE